MTARGPVFLVIEDVHWADEATLDLLRFLGRRIDESQVLLGVTYRDDEVTSGHPLRVVLGDLASTRTVRRIVVPLLSRAAVIEMSRDTTLDPERLYLATDGNPFYVSEIIAAGDETIPETVRDAVLARASRLSGAGRAVLDLAAVMGVRIELSILHGILGEAAAPIDEVLEVGLLRSWDRVLEFRHQLVQEAVAGALSPGRSRDLHARELRALRNEPATAGDFATLVHHAGEAGDSDAVLTFAPQAAAHASALGAHRQAAAHYRLALGMCPGHRRSERAALLEAWLEECKLTDQRSAATAAANELLAIARSDRDVSREATWLAHLAAVAVSDGRNSDADTASQASLDLVRDLPPDRSHAFIFFVWAALRMLNRDHVEAVTWGERAVDVAERFDDLRTTIRARAVVGASRIVNGDVERGRAEMEQSLALAREAGLHDVVATVLTNLGSGHGEMYQLGIAARYLEEGIAFTVDRDLDGSRWYVTSWLAVVRLYQGRWSDATDLADSVLRVADKKGIARIMALIALGRVRTRRGDPEASGVLDEALALAAPTGTLQRLAPAHAARAEAAWLAGDHERAAVEAAAVYDLAVAKRHRWFTAELAYWRWKSGDAPDVLDVDDTPFTLQVNGDWAGAAAMWRDLGCPYEAAWALSESGDEGALREAFATFERLGARPAMARVSQGLSDLGVHAVPRGARSSTRANPARLTTRELDVLRLLALGNTNAEIAAALFVSPKTIEHHVSAILSKLSVRTRRDAARVAAELALLG